jgi:TPR repeat protein
LAHRAGDYQKAKEWFVSAARDGWLNSVAALGAMAEESQQHDLAAYTYEIAAKRGHVDAQDALGRLAFDTETDAGYQTARYWSELAAEQGNASSQARLGTIYHEGLGVEGDPQRAARYFLGAARAGHDAAQLMIGVAYHMGVGIEANCVEAAYFVSLSARQGNGFAKAYLPRAQADLSDSEKAEVEQRLRQEGTTH